MEQKTIRFGIMCYGNVFARWQAEAITRLMELDGVTPELLIIETLKKESFIHRFFRKKKYKRLLWELYCYPESNRFKGMEGVDLTDKLGNVDRMDCEVIQKGKFSQYFTEADIETIQAHHLDFILRFAFGIIRGDVLNAAKFGVWSFHHDDEQKYRGGPPGFWEIYYDDKVSGAILQRLNEKLDAGTVLKKGYLQTDLVYTKNFDQLLLESSKWPAQLCVDIQNGNLEKLNQEPSNTKAPIYYDPVNWLFILFAIRVTYFKIRIFFKSLFFVDYWNIGVAKAKITDFLGEQKPAVEWFPLKKKDRFIADPFAVIDQNDKSKLHIFYEDLAFRKNKGVISHAAYENGFGPEQTTVLDEKTHLSYPYIFEDDGELYMIPENCEAGSISLYKSARFPHQWEKVHTLIEGFAGADSTVIKHDGLYWLFTSDMNDGINFNLHLFYSDTLTGEWTAHPRNPVKTDARSARCAGTPFIHQGDLYRPSMDYSKKVQGGITINKIVKLSKTDFAEVAVKTIEPYHNSPFSDKIHTLSAAGDYTIVDGCKETFVLRDWNFLLYSLSLFMEKVTARFSRNNRND